MKNNKKIVAMLFFIALASGFFWNHRSFGAIVDADQAVYDRIAQSLEYGDREPLYPLFLAGIYKVFGHNFDVVRVIQIVLFAFTVLFVFLALEHLVSRRRAFAAALATAFFYAIANHAGTLLTETLFIFLLSGFLFFWHRGRASNSMGVIVLAGIFLGLATLTRSVVQLLPFIFIILDIFLERKKAVRRSALFLVGFLLMVLPWMLWSRVHYDTGSVAPRLGSMLYTRADIMQNLYDDYPGHLIGYTFGYYFSQKLYPDIQSTEFREAPRVEARNKEFRESGFSYAEQDRILRKEAMSILLHNPHKFVAMSFLDFVSFHGPIILEGPLWRNTLAIHPMFADGRHAELSGFLKGSIVVMIHGVWYVFFYLVLRGIYAIRFVWKQFLWVIVFIVYLTLVYCAFHAIPRYALPLYPWYFMFAVIGISGYARRIPWTKLKSYFGVK